MCVLSGFCDTPVGNGENLFSQTCLISDPRALDNASSNVGLMSALGVLTIISHWSTRNLR